MVHSFHGLFPADAYLVAQRLLETLKSLRLLQCNSLAMKFPRNSVSISPSSITRNNNQRSCLKIILKLEDLGVSLIDLCPLPTPSSKLKAVS